MSKVGSCVSIFSFFCGTTRKPTIQSFKKQAIRKAEVLRLNEHGLGDLKWRLGAIPNAEPINYLGLLAIKYAVMNYENIFNNCKYIRINSDNTTAIAYRYKMGLIVSDSCNYLLYYCINKNDWLSVVQA